MRMQFSTALTFAFVLFIVSIELGTSDVDQLILYLLPGIVFSQNKTNINTKPIGVAYLVLISICEIVKLGVLYYLAESAILCAPVSLIDIETKQMAGIINLGFIMLFDFVAVLMGMHFVKKVCKATEQLDTLQCGLYTNDITEIVVALVAQSVSVIILTSYEYEIGLTENSLIFIFAALLVGMAYILQATSLIRARKEELIERDMKVEKTGSVVNNGVNEKGDNN